jgi:uncharacterized repeat protein (TIGR01451 family)
LCLGFLFLLTPLVGAKEPPPLAPPPPQTPVLGLRILAPPGSKATFYADGCRTKLMEVPAQVAVRPGYVYRFKLTNLPQGKDVTLYPTVEIIGALHMPPPLCPENHPVPIVISEDDIDKARAGALVTKLFVLENPDRAVPVATLADQPLENVVSPDRNLLEEAWTIGRPMVVLRLGERQATEEELLAKSIPGTMLLPGDPFLGPPALAPCVPYKCFRVTDPLHGWGYLNEECLKDGGDAPPPAGFGPDGNLHGLDPKDTVAEYVDNSGRRKLAISNRVCLCVPRYAIVRSEIGPEAVDRMLGPSHARQVDIKLAVESRLPPLLKEQIEGPELLKNRQRTQVMQEAVTAITFDQWLTTALIIGEIGPKVAIGTCVKRPQPPEAPLQLCKNVDRHCASIGDVVTFTLRYANPGGQPINNVVVNDSLTGRLEYVPGSAKSDRDAVFTTQANEAGSSILRWEIAGQLLPGQGGIITFQAKIR